MFYYLYDIETKVVISVIFSKNTFDIAGRKGLAVTTCDDDLIFDSSLENYKGANNEQR
jgi:hypothetical protein